MPALVNINVGSFRGTSGDDGTISWPFLAKKFRKVDLISLTPVMAIQSQIFGEFSEPLLDSRNRAVQKLCWRIIGLPPDLTGTVESPCRCVDRLGPAVFLNPLFETVTSGEIGLERPAPKEQPPRKLSGKRTV